MSHHFPRGGRDSTLSSEDTPHETSQSGHGGGCDSNTSASHRDQGGGGRASFRDKQVVINGSSSKIHALWQVNSAPLKYSYTNLPISYETGF